MPCNYFTTNCTTTVMGKNYFEQLESEYIYIYIYISEYIYIYILHCVPRSERKTRNSIPFTLFIYRQQAKEHHDFILQKILNNSQKIKIAYQLIQFIFYFITRQIVCCHID